MVERAKTWLRRYARPLELARWEYLFEGGSKERVIHYLAAFQNADGGFGHGIEPDFWNPNSSPMATWAAGQILVEIAASPNEEIVQKIVAYLCTVPQLEQGIWPSVMPENNNYPHAPWWAWNPDVQKTWMFNPSAELAALLIHWSEPGSVEAKLGWSSLQPAMDYVMALASLERHELANFRHCLQLLKTQAWEFNARLQHNYGDVERHLRELTRNCLDRDVKSWAHGYKPLPLNFIHSPTDPLYLELKLLVEQNLQFYLEHQTAEGVWEIPWTWGQFEGQFPVASRYWQGIVAIERYKAFKAFGWLGSNGIEAR